MNKKLIMAFVAMITLTGVASAEPSGEYGDYALSEQVTDYAALDKPAQAFLIETATDDTVTVEYLQDGEVIAAIEDVKLDGDSGGGFVTDYLNVDEYVVDQIAVYPNETDVENIEKVTHFYDYNVSQDDETNIDFYGQDQVYTSFEYVEEARLPMDLIMQIVVLMILLVAVGKATDQL